MTTRLTTAPAALAVDIEDAREALGMERTDATMDGRLTRWLKGIIATAEHETGRAFITQGWRLTLDSFPVAEDGGAGGFRLLHAPLASIQSINFIDPNGITQTLDPQDYTADLVSEPGYAVPAEGRTWPEEADRINAVWVDYTSGYGEGHETVPENVKLYILAKLVEMIDPATKTERATPQTTFIDSLLDSVKVY
jgi:uncharacterized phiE125 gp8 family phage protein